MTLSGALRSTWFRLAAALVAVFVAWTWLSTSQGVQTVERVLIFRTNVQADAHLATFFPRSDRTRLNFGPGAVVADVASLFSSEAPVAQWTGDNNTALFLYELRPESSVCAQAAALCEPNPRGIFVMLQNTPSGSVATSSYAILGRGYVPLHQLRALRIAPGAPQDLFAAAYPPENPTPLLYALEREGADMVSVDFSAAAAPVERYKPYLMAAVALIGLLTWFAPSLLSFWFASLRESPISGAVLTIWITVCSVAIFPSIFMHDTLFEGLNGYGFTTWYSTLYFLYTGVFRVLGYQYIQLPLILFGYFSLLLTLRTITVAFGAGRGDSVLKALFVIGVLASPALFAALFVQQRYFLAVMLALLGVTSALFAFIRELKGERLSVAVYTVAAVALICAALLRPEYLAFVTLLVVALAARAIVVRDYASGGFVVAVMLLLVGSRELMVRTIPDAYEHDSGYADALYQTVTALAVARPYVTCDGVVNSHYEELVDHAGGMEQYCSMGPEPFYWGQVRPNQDAITEAMLREINAEARRLVLADPEPFAGDRWIYAKSMMESEYWQLESRYVRRDTFSARPVDHHEIHPDRYGLQYDWPAVEPLNREIVPFYRDLSEIPPSYTIIAMLVVAVVVVGCFFFGAYVTGLFGAAVLGFLVPIVALSPTQNWAYIAFAPIWAAFVLPACLSEIAARRARRKSKSADASERIETPRGPLAMALGFASLSGAGWLFDMALFSVLVSVAGFAPALANFISASIAALSVFLLSRSAVFGNRGGGARPALVYLGYTWAMIVVWSFAIASLAGLLATPADDGNALVGEPSMAAIVAKVIVTPFSLALNFLVARFLSGNAPDAAPLVAEPATSNADPGKILIFIPAYRCEAQITRVLSRLEQSAGALASEIIVVDNRSPDGTAEAARQFAVAHPHMPIRVVRNRDNYGLGGSHKAAFAYAVRNGFDYVVTLHGDDQGDFGDLAPLLRAGRHRDFDAVLGARFMPGSKLQGYSLPRTLGNAAFNTLFSLTAGRPISDLGSGLNLYAVPKLRDEYYKTFADDLTFNYYMILAQRRQQLLFFPVAWREDDQISNVKVFKQTLQLVRIWWGFLFGRDSYLRREHREHRRDAYEFDDVAAPGESAPG